MSALTSLAGASPRSAPASGTSQTSSASATDSGFAGLFTQFSARTIDAQAEPTALPALQDPPTAGGTAHEDTLTEDSTAPADAGLLAALGLLPLASAPEPAPLPATLFGGLMSATPPADTAMPVSADAPLVATAVPREPAALPPAAATGAALAGAINATPSNTGADNARQPAVAVQTQTAAAAVATAAATASAVATTITAAAPVLAALNAALDPSAAEPDSTALPLDTPAPVTPALNLSTASRTATAGSAIGLTPDPDSTGIAEPAIDLAAALKLSGETLRTDTKADPAGSRIAAPGSALSFDRADLLSALRDSVSLPASLNPPPSTALDPRSAGFGVSLGQQMVWLAEQKVGRAEIRLDPEELGPLEVNLELDGDEIRAEFGSRNAEVRSLLESQVPRLREMLAEHGFSLADAQIGQERHAQQQSFAGSGGADGRTGAGIAANDASPPATAAVRVRQGLVDDYA